MEQNNAKENGGLVRYDSATEALRAYHAGGDRTFVVDRFILYGHRMREETYDFFLVGTKKDFHGLLDNMGPEGVWAIVPRVKAAIERHVRDDGREFAKRVFEDNHFGPFWEGEDAEGFYEEGFWTDRALFFAGLVEAIEAARAELKEVGLKRFGPEVWVPGKDIFFEDEFFCQPD